MIAKGTPTLPISTSRRTRCGWRIAHNDIDGAVRTIEQIAATPKAELAALGQRGSDLIDRKYSMAILRTAYCDVVEWGLAPVERPVAATA